MIRKICTLIHNIFDFIFRYTIYDQILLFFINLVMTYLTFTNFRETYAIGITLLIPFLLLLVKLFILLCSYIFHGYPSNIRLYFILISLQHFTHVPTYHTLLQLFIFALYTTMIDQLLFHKNNVHYRKLNRLFESVIMTFKYVLLGVVSYFVHCIVYYFYLNKLYVYRHV